MTKDVFQQGAELTTLEMNKPRTLCLLHTGAMLVPVFAELAKELLPGVKLFHMLDESLIQNTVSAGKLEKVTIRRLFKEIECAREGGADVVMVTCSSLGPAIALARQAFDFPVLRVDQAMAGEAVRHGQRVGVLATLPTTLAPTCDLVRETARAMRRKCTVVTGLCPGAFEAVRAGNGAEHDRLVTRGLLELMEKVDVVVLAQASMARVIQQIPPEQLRVPVLSSPRLGLQHAQETLAALAG